MREILFRAKRVDNGEWVEGYYVPDCFWGTNVMIVFPFKYPIDVTPETVSEFTGLTDKNGAKIFENDIVKAKDDTGHVYYNSQFGIWLIETKTRLGNKASTDFSPSKLLSLERIGNIFDNPELLK